MKEKTAVLVLNTGSPDSYQTKDVQKYLNEFLMDPFVVDIPYPIRWYVMKKSVIPKRAPESAKLYQKIWTTSGSPLLAMTTEFCKKLQDQLQNSSQVFMAMRYGNPSIASVAKEIRTFKKCIVLPMFPQYASATTESILAEVMANLVGMSIQVIPPFYNQEEFVHSWMQLLRDENLEPEHHLLFTFHGLPEKQIRKSDGLRRTCLKKMECCEQVPVPTRCYRAQCVWTAKELAHRLGRTSKQWSVSFQSRLGGGRWLGPYTDEVLALFPRQGIKKLSVVCPAFTTDCLETLEEIGMRGREVFEAAGGQEFKLLPCLNARDYWVRAVSGWVKD